MARVVECLSCGQTREVVGATLRGPDAGECPRCGYLGWAFAEDVDRRARRLLLNRPPMRRRLYAV